MEEQEECESYEEDILNDSLERDEWVANLPKVEWPRVVDPENGQWRDYSDDGETESESDYEEEQKCLRTVCYLQGLQLGFGSAVNVGGEALPGDKLTQKDLLYIARQLDPPLTQPEETAVGEPAHRAQVCFIKGVVETREPCEGPGVEDRRKLVLEDFKDKVFRRKNLH